MPVYDYKCNECGKITELAHNINTKIEIWCDCGGDMEKQISSSVIKFNCSMPTPQKKASNN